MKMLLRFAARIYAFELSEAMMIFRGAWKGRGVFNVEELPPGPFLEELGPQGLPWHVRDLAASEQSELLALQT